MPPIVKTETTIKEFNQDGEVVRTVINTQEIIRPEPEEGPPIGLYL